MTEPRFGDLLGGARRRALHLETRDLYKPDDPVWLDWHQGLPVDAAARYRSWYDLVSQVIQGGVVVRRARVVSEPVSRYVRFEYEITDALNIAAGEQVRWLPRNTAPQLLVSLGDFWVFDDTTVLWYLFSGDGATARTIVETDPAAVKLCTDVFETVWDRGIPHAQYHPQ